MLLFSLPQRPRYLDVFYGTNVTLSQLQEVVVAVTNVGTLSPALTTIELIMDDGTRINVFTASAATPQPACPALNAYAVSPSVSSGPKAGMYVRGVRVSPNQAKVVKDKSLMLHVSMRRHCRKQLSCEFITVRITPSARVLLHYLACCAPPCVSSSHLICPNLFCSHAPHARAGGCCGPQAEAVSSKSDY